ncbi:GATA zinc finger domain-containing protein 1-like [Penaeus monodon]|uniref:GATA zinc finger domain-containing protein 1-like n=1 Tax=Penaeus monodon TaxID=6687 RepID=UPI0018A7C049|nr:GATA zinc finger domain-containing protein 1-like [Penaeus monodon]
MMVFGVKPECARCKATECSIWRRDERDQVLCTACSSSAQAAHPPRTPPKTPGKEDEEDARRDEEDARKDDKADAEEHKDADSSNGNGGKDEDHEGEKDKETGKTSEKRETKRKTRKGRQGGKGSIPKGKGRRYIFKKSATKAPVAVATPVTSEYLFYKGLYYQVGDIVSVIDVDGGTYYAQIRGLLQDQYCEKSAVLTWLIPTKNSPPPEESFDPSTYIIGPEEDIPRKLEYMEFECHAPSDYFKDRTSPYSTMTYQPQSCFIWSRLGPQIKPIEKAKELMAK